jgi:hypothetical protein
MTWRLVADVKERDDTPPDEEVPFGDVVIDPGVPDHPPDNPDDGAEAVQAPAAVVDSEDQDMEVGVPAVEAERPASLKRRSSRPALERGEARPRKVRGPGVRAPSAPPRRAPRPAVLNVDMDFVPWLGDQPDVDHHALDDGMVDDPGPVGDVGDEEVCFEPSGMGRMVGGEAEQFVHEVSHDSIAAMGADATYCSPDGKVTLSWVVPGVVPGASPLMPFISDPHRDYLLSVGAVKPLRGTMSQVSLTDPSALFDCTSRLFVRSCVRVPPALPRWQHQHA